LINTDDKGKFFETFKKIPFPHFALSRLLKGAPQTCPINEAKKIGPMIRHNGRPHASPSQGLGFEYRHCAVGTGGEEKSLINFKYLR